MQRGENIQKAEVFFSFSFSLPFFNFYYDFASVGSQDTNLNDCEVP